MLDSLVSLASCLSTILSFRGALPRRYRPTRTACNVTQTASPVSTSSHWNALLQTVRQWHEGTGRYDVSCTPWSPHRTFFDKKAVSELVATLLPPAARPPQNWLVSLNSLLGARSSCCENQSGRSSVLCTGASARHVHIRQESPHNRTRPAVSASATPH